MDDFDNFVDEEVLDMDRDDDWGDENDDDLGFDSPTDGDEYVMNPDDSFEDPYDPYDIEYDR